MVLFNTKYTAIKINYFNFIIIICHLYIDIDQSIKMLNTDQNIKAIRGKDIEPKTKLKHAAKHHVDSFDFAIDTLLLKRLPQYLD